jgi:lysophospholipase L1-like esterase
MMNQEQSKKPNNQLPLQEIRTLKIYLTVMLMVFVSNALASNSTLTDTSIFGMLKYIQEFEDWDRENSYPDDAILFVGSSSINRWKTAEAFPGKKVINRGFGGAVTADVLFFYDSVIKKYSPSTVVIFVGSNDIARRTSVDLVVKDLTALIEKIHQDLPKTKIIYLPISPTPLRERFWGEMSSVNQKIAELAKTNKHLLYVDTATPLMDDKGKPIKAYFVLDGLHLNDSGYKVWNDVIREYLQ